MIKHIFTLGFTITYILGGLNLLSNDGWEYINFIEKHTTTKVLLSNPYSPPCDITFVQQPQDVVLCPGTFAQFRANVVSNNGANLFFQWQVAPDSNSPFTDIIIFTDNYDGSTTQQLSIENVTGLEGYRYRLCVFAANCDRVYSNIVTLRNAIIQQPQDLEICLGDTATFNISFGNQDFAVQWQVATGSGATFTPLTDNTVYQGTQTPNLTINDVTGLDGFYFQAVLTSPTCEVLSPPALLTVRTLPVIEDAVITMCSNVPMIIDLQGLVPNFPSGLNLSYEVIAIDSNLVGVPLGTTGLENPMHTWINNGTDLGTVTYLITTINPPTSCDDFSFRLILQIFPDLQAIVDPGGSLNVCPGDSRMLSSVVLNGVEPYIHLWNILSVSGTATATLNGSGSSIHPMPILTGTGTGTVKVRYVAVDGQGCFSSPHILTFQFGAPVILENITGNLSPCEGSLETYTVLSSVNIYQWEVSTGGQIVGAANNAEVNILWNGPAGTSATLGVTAGSGCTIMETTQVFIQESPTVTVETTDITCFGENDGTATLFINGMFNPPNSTYQWNNGFSTPSGTGLSAGDYIVTVTNENNCTNVVTFDIEEPDILSTLVLTAHVTCEGNVDGAATVIPTGGTAPYSFLWSTGSTNMTIFNLSEGTYQVTVTDANGCQQLDEADIHTDEPLEATLTVVNAPCENTGIGSASVEVTGGRPPYFYQWLNSGGQLISTASFVNGLMGGHYSVVITDQNGCAVTEFFMIEGQDIEPPALTCFASNAYLVQLNDLGQATINVQDVLEEVTDNCGVQQVTFADGTTNISFDCNDLQVVQTLTLTAVDVNGNTSTCTRLVLVQDIILPTIDCGQNAPTVLYLNQNGQASLTAAEVVTTADNCGVSWVRFFNGALTQNYDCDDVGLTTETIIVTDASGNAASCMLDVEVLDEQIPLIDCGDNPIYIDLENQSSITLNVNDLVTVTDNCEIVSLTFQNGQPTISFNCGTFEPGTQAIVTAQDASNNATTCIINVEISPDAGLPQVVCPTLPHLLTLEADGTRTLFAADLVQVSGDDCLVRSIEFLTGVTERTYDCSHVGIDIVLTVMVRGYGTETSSCTRMLVVSDPLNVCGNR